MIHFKLFKKNFVQKWSEVNFSNPLNVQQKWLFASDHSFEDIDFGISDTSQVDQNQFYVKSISRVWGLLRRSNWIKFIKPLNLLLINDHDQNWAGISKYKMVLFYRIQ